MGHGKWARKAAKGVRGSARAGYLWGAMAVVRRPQPNVALTWLAIIASSLLFALAHLPLAGTVGQITPSVVGFIMVANAFVGMLLGWLFWSRGLLAATIAHASIDVVMKVIIPPLTA